MKQSEIDRDISIDLWAEESAGEMAAGGCSMSSATTVGTASTPVASIGSAACGGSLAC